MKQETKTKLEAILNKNPAFDVWDILEMSRADAINCVCAALVSDANYDAVEAENDIEKAELVAETAEFLSSLLRVLANDSKN